MQIIKPGSGTEELAVEVLKKGGLVIIPTETVYGAMVDATNSKAVEKLTKYKKRPLGKPYSIAVADQEMAEEYAELNETARNLYKKFLPGPVTIISKLKIRSLREQKSNIKSGSKFKLAPGVSSELGTVGVRIPDYKLVTDIVKRLGRPVTATSANASYKKRPYKITDILENISDKQKSLIDLIVDAGELAHNEPSTVIDTTLDDPMVLRQGTIVLSTKCGVLSRSEEDTQNIGKELWQKYEQYAGQRAIIFSLEGPMGAGKTVFTKGLARALGITDKIVSPTYNLQLSYLTPSPLQNLGEGHHLVFNHMDMWRIQSGEELEGLGLAGLINDKSVLAIEWADRVAETIRKYSEEAVIIWVKISYGKKINERVISWGIL
jgi:L-threonylcarbamoyladenylate synthase